MSHIFEIICLLISLSGSCSCARKEIYVWTRHSSLAGGYNRERVIARVLGRRYILDKASSFYVIRFSGGEKRREIVDNGVVYRHSTRQKQTMIKREADDHFHPFIRAITWLAPGLDISREVTRNNEGDRGLRLGEDPRWKNVAAFPVS